ncbi:MAG: DNA-J related domain-containing protein [Pseudomonadota bacterium]|nr:DNA-J related domain-containing protein [Pseudomonadota bacterium]
MRELRQNPLIPAILTQLRRNLHTVPATPFGIHHLLASLSQHPCLAQLDDHSELSLFKKNFLLMNGLYQLQGSLWDEERLSLQIAPLDIRLHSAQPTHSSQRLPEPDDPMREYYLDWSHYHETTREDVVALLQGFWHRLEGDERRQALVTLALGEGASATDIKQRYQRLARQHHPDRGGDQARFMEIRAAYELLRC